MKSITVPGSAPEEQNPVEANQENALVFDDAEVASALGVEVENEAAVLDPPQIKASLKTGLTENPDEAAGVLKLSQDFGVPFSAAKLEKQTLTSLSRLNQVNVDSLVKKFPATARFLTAPDLAAISHDSIPQMQNTEGVFNSISRGTAKAKASENYVPPRFREIFFEATPEEKQAAQVYKKQLDLIAREGAGKNFVDYTAEGLGYGAGQFATSVKAAGLPGIVGAALGAAGSAAGGPALAAAGARLGFQIGAGAGALNQNFKAETVFAYDEFEKIPGIDPDVAKGAAVAVGAINSALETYGEITIANKIPGIRNLVAAGGKEAIQKILADRTKSEIFKRIAKDFAVGGVTEAITEGLQELSNMVVGVIAEGASPNASGEQARGKLLGTGVTTTELGMGTMRALESAYGGLLGATAAQSVALPGGLALQRYQEKIDADRAESQKNLILNLTKASKENKVADRSTDAFSNFIEQTQARKQIELKETPANVFIPVTEFDRLMQESGVNPKEAATKAGAINYDEAKLAGSDVMFDLGKYFATLGRGEQAVPLSNHIRLFQEDQTYAEYQKSLAQQKEALDILVKVFNEAQTEANQKPENTESAKPSANIVQHYKDQLVPIIRDISGPEITDEQVQAQADVHSRVLAKLEQRGAGGAISGLSLVSKAYGSRVASRLKPFNGGVAQASPGASAAEVVIPGQATDDAATKVQATADFDVNSASRVLDLIRKGKTISNKQVYGPSLGEFVISRGGISRKNDALSGDLKALDDGQKWFQYYSKANKGMSLSRMIQAAREAGYFEAITNEADDFDNKDFLDALSAERRGEPTYAKQNYNFDAFQEQQTLSDVQSKIEELGLDITKLTNDEVITKIAESGGLQRASAEVFLQNQTPVVGSSIVIDGVEKPTQNSNGEFIADTEEKIRNFYKWFGDSRVVDEQGRPIVVYHGTKSDAFEVFDTKKIGAQGSTEGYGFYFTSNKDVALGYKPQGSGWLFSGYLRAEKPMSVDQKPLTLAKLKSIIKAIVETEINEDPSGVPNYQNSFLSNFVDTSSSSFEESVSITANIIKDGNKTAIDQIAELANVSGNKDAVLAAVKKVTGFDAVVSNGFGNKGGSPIYVAFSPSQLKSDTGNSGAFDANNPNILFQEDISDLGFYSQLIRTIEEKMGTSATKQQVEGMLKEIKPEERKWLGVDEFLKGKTKVSKQELLDFLSVNNPNIKEVVYSENYFPDVEYLRSLEDESSYQDELLSTIIKKEVDNIMLVSDMAREDVERYVTIVTQNKKLNDLDVKDYEYALARLANYNVNEEFLQQAYVRQQAANEKYYLEKSKQESFKNPKFAQYQLPGGDNYREVLFTLPEKYPHTLPDGYRVVDRGVDSPSVSARFLVLGPSEGIGAIDGVGRYGSGPTEQDAINNYNKMHRSGGRFTSSHFEEPNTLAHVRLNDRTDADGKNILFVEEIQSDWHQAGRKRGYKDPSLTQRNFNDFVAQKYPEQVSDVFSMWQNDTNPIYKEWLAEQDAALNNVNAVPDAPFRKTWQDFVLKRVIRMAAEGGYDAVAWTTGEQQNERYDLSKQVGFITYEEVLDSDPREFEVSVFDKNDNNILEKSGTAQELEDVVGKDIVNKMLAGDGENTTVSLPNGNRADVKKLSGNDLKVGGSGMKGFYDKILVDSANKLGKKFGAKVQDVSIDVTQTGYLNLTPVYEGPIPTVQQLKDAIATSPSVSVTLQLRDAIYNIENPGDMEQLTGDDYIKAVLSNNLSDLSAQHIGGKIARIQEKRSAKVHSLPLTPQLKEAAIETGFPLFQDKKSVKRGYLEVGTGKHKGTLNLVTLKDGDFSTFSHEMAHAYLEIMGGLASAENAPEDVKSEYAKILEFIGAKPGEKVKRFQHEKFARAFEAYLMEGKAPSLDLKEAFLKFKNWMTKIYKQILNLNVKLTDDVRGVFDRMIASDEQIEIMKSQVETTPLFESAEQAGLSQAEFETYKAATASLDDEAKKALFDRLMAEARQKKTFEYQEAVKKIRQEVEAEYDALSSVITFKALTTDAEVDGVNVKINRDDTYERLGDEYAGKIPQEVLKDDGTMSIEEAARTLGYDNFDDMVQELENMPNREQYVEANTDIRVAAELGDILTDGSIQDEAMKALHSEARAAVIATELRALEKKAPRPGTQASIKTPPQAQLKRLARNQILAMSLKNIKPYIYLRASRKYNRESFEALRKRDYAAARDLKTKELANHYLFLEAQSAILAGQKISRYAKRLDKKTTRERIGKAGNGYLDQMDALLYRYGFRKSPPSPLAKRKSLSAWVKELENDGEPIQVDGALLENDLERVNYQDIPMEELLAIYDALKSIESLARLQNRLLTNASQQSLEDVVNQIVDRITDVNKYVNAKKYKDEEDVFADRTKSDNVTQFKMTSSLMGIEMRKLSSLIFEMDGFKRNGPLFKAVEVGANRAGAFEAAELAKVTKQLNDIISPAIKDPTRGGKPNSKYYRSLRVSLTWTERMAMLLNWGNASNRQRLVGGGLKKGWTEEGIQEVINDMTKEDWDLAQNIWDLMESFRPMIAEKQRRVYGVEPNWIEAEPISTKYGIYRGGYYPVKYDARLSGKAQEQDMAEEAKSMLQGAMTASTTSRTFTKDRVEEVFNRPLVLTWDPLFRGLQEIIHDVAWHEWLIDTNRIFRNPRVEEIIRENYGPEFITAIKRLLENIASGDKRATGWDRALNHLRSGSAIAGLGLNFTNAFINLTGYAQSANKIGLGWALSAAQQVMTNPRESYRTVMEKSSMMRSRSSTYNKEVNQIKGMLESRSNTSAVLNMIYMLPATATQIAVDVPTWLASYNKSIAEGLTEQEARDLADSDVLAAQGGGQAKDQALVLTQGSAAWKAFVMFMSYFNTTYNLTVEATKKAKLDLQNPNISTLSTVVDTAYAYLTIQVMPVVLTVAIKLAISKMKGEEPDEDKALRLLAAEQISYSMAMIPLVREIAPAVQLGFGVLDFNRGYQGTPAQRVFTESYALAKEYNSDGFNRGLLRSTVNVGGVLFKYPSGQANRTLDYMIDLADGKAGNPVVIIVGKPSKKK